MGIMNELKLTSEKRSQYKQREEDRLRVKLLEKLEEQKEIAEADNANQPIVKTRQIYVTDENGERVPDMVKRRLRRWYWRNHTGTWLMELRYGGKALKIDGGKTAIEVGDKAAIPAVIDRLIEAVKAGELDKALIQAKKERVTAMRKAR